MVHLVSCRMVPASQSPKTSLPKFSVWHQIRLDLSEMAFSRDSVASKADLEVTVKVWTNFVFIGWETCETKKHPLLDIALAILKTQTARPWLAAVEQRISCLLIRPLNLLRCVTSIYAFVFVSRPVWQGPHHQEMQTWSRLKVKVMRAWQAGREHTRKSTRSWFQGQEYCSSQGAKIFHPAREIRIELQG